MALLDVHQRTVETRIAYVGVDASGLAANMTALEARGGARAVAEAGLQTLALGELPRAGLRDCSLHVTIVTPAGAPSRETLQRVLEDVDGVVVVLDSDPGAVARNRDCLSVLEDVVVDRALPLVVQWLGGGAMEPALPEGLHARSTVRAVTGDARGFDETLDTAVEAVMESMTGHERDEEERLSPIRHQGEGNPLLDALRRVLERTAEAQATKLSDSVTSRIEGRMETRLAALTERLAAIELSNRELAAMTSRAATNDDLATFSASVEQRAASEREKLAAMESANDLFWRHLTTANDELLAAARHSCSREDLAAAVASILGELRRTTDAVTQLREQVAAVRASVATLPTLERVSETAVAAVRHGSTRLADQVRAADARVQALGKNLERLSAAEGERNERIDAAVSSIVEEMKKPKKGWFG